MPAKNRSDLVTNLLAVKQLPGGKTPGNLAEVLTDLVASAYNPLDDGVPQTGGVTPTSTTTFTNKSIDGATNTLTNVPASALTGVVAPAHLGTGTASSTTILYGDGTYKTAPTGSGSGDALVANPLSQFAATTSAQLKGVISDETGSGALVFATSPTLVTPALGTPSAAVLTSATGLPLTTGVTGVLPVANGGTGTASPGILAGTNVSVTGTWPNQTVNSTATGTFSSTVETITAVSAAGTSATARPSGSNFHTAYLSAGAGSGAYTRIVPINTTNTPATGNKVRVLVSLAASANPTIEFRNTDSSGTVLATLTNAQAVADDVAVDFTYSGSAWVRDSSTNLSTVGDASTNTTTSVDSEVALFSSTGGKTLKRATGTGIATLTSGVLSTTSTNGTGNVVLTTTPTLVTPVLGVATATSINGNTITTGTGTLTLGAGKTLTVSNSVTFAGTDATTMTFPEVSASIGFRNVPQNSQSTAYTLVLTDSGKHILHPSADTTARTFTIPANSSVAFPIGTSVTFVNQNAGGVITIAITTDTMRLAGAGTTGSRTLAANGVATALKITSTEWIISGGSSLT